jgi:hypothetical protein
MRSTERWIIDKRSQRVVSDLIGITRNAKLTPQGFSGFCRTAIRLKGVKPGIVKMCCIASRFCALGALGQSLLWFILTIG